MPDEVRVLIADDHAVVRSGLRLFLELQPDITVVGEAENGVEALERVEALRPHVVLMDVVMPELDGIEATRALRRCSPETRVLALSSFTDEERVLPALRAGAAGYLTKDTEPDEIAEAIRAVRRGEPVLCREATRRVLAQVAGSSRRPEGTVTVLFTDVEGSTAIVDALGDVRARELFREHDRLVRNVLSGHSGVEVEKEGDAFMLAFASARHGVLCAAEIQRALDKRERDPESPIRVRIGLNTGDVMAEGDRYFGRAVFIASRVAGEAAGGEILVSELTRSLVGDDGIQFRDRGHHQLRGLKGTHRLYEVAWREP